jgi:hypothetical protein
MKHAPRRLLQKLSAVLFLALGVATSCLTPSFILELEGPHCDNTISDADESGVDCGGNTCNKCPVGQGCNVDTDCIDENCVSKECAAASCQDDKINQGETDNDCGGPCGATCDTGESCEVGGDCMSGFCRALKCAEASCADGVTNNAETDTDCGGSLCKDTCDVGQLCKTNADCRQPESLDGVDRGVAQCVPTEVEGERRCELMCPPRRGDCDLLASTGCETNTDTSASHCGECNSACDLPQASLAHCELGVCQIDECAEGFDDCDPTIPGCETNLNDDPTHCGTCETVCSDRNGTASCQDGACDIECEDGFEDCDEATNPGKNGCETNILANADNCGGCSVSEGDVFDCPGDIGSGIYPVCVNGECDQVDCGAYENLAACESDGLCDDPISSPDNCGACGVECVVENGEPECALVDGEFGCGVASCNENFANCDGTAVDCEVDIRTNSLHCGGCADEEGTDCAALMGVSNLHVADAICQDKACVLACEPGYIDCDGDVTNGCEADAKSTSRCGGCLPTDAVPGIGENCEETFPDAPELICNDDNLCEVSCPEATCPDATGSCDIPLGSVESCLACGQVCTAPEGAIPYCNGSSGCQVVYPVQVLETKSGYNSAGTSAPNLNVSIDVGSGPNRGLLILAHAAHTPTLTFGATEIEPIAEIQVLNHTGYVSVGFLNDAQLGAAGTKTITLAATWGGKVMTLLELKDVAQGAPRDINLRTAAGCAAALTQLTDVSTPGSLVVAALHLQLTGTLSGAPIGVTEVIDQFAPEQLTGLNGYTTGVASSPTIGWNVSASCWNYGLVTASFNPRVAAQ